jgi:hypothetical protein
VYDDLYGNSSDVEVAVNNRTTREASRYDNPDFQSANGVATNEGSADYYDESYLSSRKVQRRVTDEPGYNSGFREGYMAGQNAMFDPFFMNSYGGFWPGASSSFRMGFQMGINRSLRFGMSPFIGMGGMYAWNRMGYSPWGFNSWGYDPFMGGMAMGGWGSPFYGMNGMGMYGMGDPFWGYGGFNSWGNPYGGYYGGYGMNPWAYNRPVVVVNNNTDRNEYRRTYGPRGSSSGVRSTDAYNRDFSNATRTNRNAASGRQGVDSYDNSATNNARGTTSSDAYYARPRSNSSGTYYDGNSSSGRAGVGAASSTGDSRRSSANSDYYYSRPRSNSSGTYRSSSSPSTRSYENSSPASNSRSYESGTRSNSTYQAPSRSNSTPSYNQSSPRSSAPMPSSSPSSGSSAPRSRGPR